MQPVTWNKAPRAKGSPALLRTISSRLCPSAVIRPKQRSSHEGGSALSSGTEHLHGGFKAYRYMVLQM